jgi:Transglycosylase SLT domain/Peptidase family M23
LTRRIIATGLAGAALYAATLGALATAQDAAPASSPDATPAASAAPVTPPPHSAPLGTPAPTQTSTPAAPTPSSTASPVPSPVETTVAPSPAPTQSATATPGATPSATSTATPGATATPGQAGNGATSGAHTGAGVRRNVQTGGTGSAKACGKGEHSTSTSGRDCSTAPKPTTSEPEVKVPSPQLNNSDGSPAPSNPTFSLATPGPARVGVPNFFIDKFRIPPFLLPIYQAAGMQYGIRWEVLAAINEIETDYGRNLNISSAGAVGWMQFMPATWKMYGVDANRDGVKDPFNPVDAIFAAARYLRAAGGDQDLRRAIFSYNHADWYVDSVLMRAQVIGGLPTDLVGSLTGLTQGRFPVAARATYAGALRHKGRRVKAGNAAMVVESDGSRKSIDIFSRDNAPVIAVSDGRVTKMGQNKKLGRFVQVTDVYGNTYTYAHLGSISKTYPAPKPHTVRKGQVRRELHLPKPKAPASTTHKIGAKVNEKAARKGRAPAAAAKPAAPVKQRVAAHHTAAAATVPAKADKQRLFAHPNRPNARVAGGAEQLGQAAAPSPAASTRAPLGFKATDFVPKKLKKGARLIGGTIIGRLGKHTKTQKAHLRFQIRPAGRGAPQIDPKPILDGWKLLESTAVYRAAGRNPFFGADAETPSIGQILLMSKETLVKRVLADRRIQIYACGRNDVATGQIDRRVLATLEFLASSGLKPTVTALKCGHGLMTSSGNISEHTTGTAVDIGAINGIVISPATQGPGSITDITIQRLLNLQGTMKPHQIISLMTFKDADNTLAMADHYNHIHVGWRPLYGENRRMSRQVDAILKPQQWIKLIDRLSSIDNPVVREQPSRFSVKVTRRAQAGAGD